MLIVPNLRGLQLPCHVSVTYCSNKNTEANSFNDLPAEPERFRRGGYITLVIYHEILRLLF